MMDFVPDDGFATCQDDSAYPESWDGAIVAWCPSIGPTGGTLGDWSGFSNNGTLTGTTSATVWSRFRGQGALLTDGSDDRVVAPDSPSLAITKDITVSFWVCPLESGSAKEMLTKMGNGEATSGAPWEIYRTAGSKAHFRLNNTPGESTAANMVTSAADVAQDALTFVVARKRADVMSIWINGILSGANSGSGDIPTSTGSLSLAAYTGGSFPLAAYWDDIRIRNYAISDGQIVQEYAAGFGRGMAYTPRRRRMWSAPAAGFNPAWAGNRSRIIGQGLGL